MSSIWWQAKFPLSEALVRELIENQFPELAPARPVYLDEGWDP